jgi:hypothetical protein
MDASDPQPPARVCTISMHDPSVKVLLAPVGPALREKIDQALDNNPLMTLLMSHLAMASTCQQIGALTTIQPGYMKGLPTSPERLRLIQRVIYRSGMHNRIIFMRQGSSFDRIAYAGLGELDPMEGFGAVFIFKKMRLRSRDTCTYCGRASPCKLKLCSTCKVARYCNTSCQRAHWSIHRKTCHATVATAAACSSLQCEAGKDTDSD